MGSIFISYRRDDGGHGWALYEFLCHWFDDADLFFDHESLGSGQKFRPELISAIRRSQVFLAVIGPHWFSDRNRQRLFDADDTTRGEIQTALEQETAGLIANIPVLCGGAVLPDKFLLPAEIAALCDSNAHHLPESQYRPAQQELLDHLKNIGLAPLYRHRHGTTQFFHTIDHNLTPYFSDPAGNLPLLFETLHETGNAALIASTAAATLQGMGGVGKTQLALKYSRDFRDEYAGVWWFRANDLGRLQQDCQQFCERCGIQVYTGEEHHQAVKRWLREQPRWLLVYDNAEAQYGEQKETLHPFLPGGDHHVLITSRNNCWDGLAKPIELDVWNEGQALEFLRKRLEKATDEELRQLSRALGGLPLALEQACAYIVKTGVSVDGYCKALEDWEKGQELLDRKDSLATGYSHSVLATLSLVFCRLSDAAKELLRLCAWCASEPIPDYLFRMPAAILPDALNRSAADDLLWGEMVAELTGFALAQRVVVDLTPSGEKEQLTGRALLLHRLTQAVVIRCLCDAAGDATSLTELVGQAFPKDLSSTGYWPHARALAPHVLSLEEHFATGHVPHRAISSLLNQVATYLRDCPALYDQSVAIFRRALSLDEKNLGPDHHDTLTSMNNLATMLCRIGDHQGAKALQEQVLERRKKILGPDHPDILTSMNNLATTLETMGDYQGAKALEEQVLERRKLILGQDHPHTLSSMNNLATTLKTMGDYQGAKALGEQVLERSNKLLGQDHPLTLTSMNNLAETLRAMGDHQGAKALQEHALERIKEILGQDHPDTLSSMNNLAEMLSAIGDHQGAKALHEHVLECRKELLGQDHPHTLSSMNNLATTLKAMGDYHGAKALQEHVLERRKELLGPDHPSTLTSMNNLALTLCGMTGGHQGAKMLQEHVLERRKDLLGPDHPDTTAAAWNLFMTLDQMTDRTTAQTVIDKHLIWLLGEGVELHSADQQKIRDWLRQIIAPQNQKQEAVSGVVAVLEED